MMKKIHFSVDDTMGCFFWLDQNYRSVRDVFASTTFGFAKKIYEKYGISTSFYCMYTDGKNRLSDVKMECTEQFQKNRTWMKFGFHCYDSESDYSKASEEKIRYDYEQVLNGLTRITGGGACITDAIRLHFFAGNSIAIEYLKKCGGVKTLFCADDERISYNLSLPQNKVLKKRGFYFDEHMGMNYIATDVRLEKIRNIEAEIDKIHNKNWDNLVVFTHEKYLKEVEIQRRLEILLKEFVC